MLKMNVLISGWPSGWPFRGLSHSLHVEMENEIKLKEEEEEENECSPLSSSATNAGGSVVWMKVSFNGVTSYPFYYKKLLLCWELMKENNLINNKDMTNLIQLQWWMRERSIYFESCLFICTFHLLW